MDSRELIGQLSQKEPLNPYQIAGMAAVIDGSGVRVDDLTSLEIEEPAYVLMVLDRTGREASAYLVDLVRDNSRITIVPKFPRERLNSLLHMTSLVGRRQAIAETLIPILYEIPNWLDLVRTLARYSMERDDSALDGHVGPVMEIISGYLYAAIRQPFDSEAAAESEYALCRVVESILKSASESVADQYLPFLERSLDFLLREVFSTPLNPFERRILEIAGIRSALKRHPAKVQSRVDPYLDKMGAQALITALEAIPPCPDHLISRLSRAVAQDDFPEKEQFQKEILERTRYHSSEEVERRRQNYSRILEGNVPGDQEVIREGINFIKGLGDEWRVILDAFLDLIEVVPAEVQSAFSEVLAVQILNIEKPEVKELLVDGLCRIVLRLEKTKKQASKDLTNLFVTLFMDRAHSSLDTKEVVSCLKAVESLGVALGRNGYFLMARELMDQLTRRPLIRPQEKKYTIEDDDTGEPLVLAEDTAANRAHVQHIKSLMSMIASNPRIMYRLTPYLIVGMELGGALVHDEDLIQYWISCLLRSNSSVTHFLNRTLIKAIPYSFKDIGPLDTLRLTAAGLAKELANRGVKPIGNFLGKLRGDIHWHGSMENFYFCRGILKYLATGDPEHMADWMPQESMPYLTMDQWCSIEEAEGIKSLCWRIFKDHEISFDEKDGLNALVGTDMTRYREDGGRPEFATRVVFNLMDLLKGLHAKYFITTQSAAQSTVTDDLERLERVVRERSRFKEQFLIPDISDPMPQPVTLTEGGEDYVHAMESINHEQPGTPIVLRAKKAGHAYAQKATYIEERFEAFNKDLSLESFQETIASTLNNSHFRTITSDNLGQAFLFLDCLVKGISVNGHSGYYLDQAASDLRNAGPLELTFDKARDLLRILKRELNDIFILYRSYFDAPVDRCLADCPVEKLPRKLRDLTTLKEIPESDFFKNYLKTLYISDLQARDGNLRVLEIFVDKIELFLNQRLAESTNKVVPGHTSHERRIPLYFPDQSDDISSCIIGLKASLLRFAENTPPYFVITTDQPLDDPHAMLNDDEFRDVFTEAVKKLESRIGKVFGDPVNPAIFSVRSGSRISMPGMMITVTNVAINDEIAARLAQQMNPWFAYDSYRRFLQEFGQAVFGIAREEFQAIIDDRKTAWRVTRKAEMSAEQMMQLAFAYKKRVAELAPEAVELIDSGRFMDILIRCALVVLYSYEGRAARIYRQAAGISGNWKTPAIVQAMVYGNIDFAGSGTGVVSYDPLTMDLRGVYSRRDQGTDVVDGKVNTIPVYDKWKRGESLASHMPDAWQQLSSMLYRIAERLHLSVTVEYTIEQGRVYILQIRKNREVRERLPRLKDSGYNVIASGTGVSGKIFRGIMVTDRNQIAPYRHINKAQAIIDAMNEGLPEADKLDGFIFVVNDPIPEEIMEEVYSLPVATALVSRLGGGGAHAADISKALGKVYVGQVRRIMKFSGKPEAVCFGDHTMVVGSKMIIHGQTGEIALFGKSLGDRS